MKIQYISLNQKQYDRFTCSTFSSYQTIDSFDCNVVDLSEPEVWKSRYHFASSIDCEEELAQLCSIIYNSKKNNIIFLLPDNIEFRYSSSIYSSDYSRSIRLKENLANFKNILTRCNVINKDVGIGFEDNSTTLINSLKVKSSFYFAEDYDLLNPVLKADYSEKQTAVSYLYAKIFFTFSHLKDEDTLLAFLSSIGIESDAGDIPSWLNSYCAFNDAELKEEINSFKKQIHSLSDKVQLNEKELKKNLYYKEMLVCNGDDLVERVYKTLEEILNVDLSHFVDKKEADFIFEKNGVVFVGEIKGISTNVKNENVSQVDVHESLYIDSLEENGQPIPNIKKLLIINHQRNKAIFDREPVNSRQKSLAIKNNVLIVETVTMITILEKYRKNELTQEAIVEMLKNSSGLLIVS